MTQHRQPPKDCQRGAVLITSLIILLVLILISISGMNLSFLENMMATNTQFQVSALADAEVALRTAEQDVESLVSDGTALDLSADDHYHQNGTIDPSQSTWSFNHATSNGSNYVIEYVGQRVIPGNSTEIGAGAAGSFVYLFLVDAQSTSGKGATRNVQTAYITATAP